jgi:L-gulonolactone oxidase
LFWKSSVVGIKNWRFLNWAETYSCTPLIYFEPNNVDELREILRMAEANKKKLRVVGVGHSPSSIACSNDYMVSLKKFNKIIDVNQFCPSILVT